MTYLDRDARHGRARRARPGRPTRRTLTAGAVRRRARPDRDQAVEGRLVRQIKGNSYVEDLAAGDAVLAMAWSGDITLIQPGQTKDDRTSSGPSPKRAACSGRTTWPSRRAPRTRSRRGSVIDFYYDPANAAGDRGVRQLRLPGQGRRRTRCSTIDPELANNPLIFPPADWLARLHQFRARHDGRGGQSTWTEAFTKADAARCSGRADGACADRLHGDRAVRSCWRRACSGLLIFFIYPAIQMFLVSLWTGNVQDGFQLTWNWSIYPEAFQEYWPWFVRSIVYGGLATILAFAARLSARLRDRLPRRPLQEPAAVPRHRPVLHELPAADPVLEDHPRGQRASSSGRSRTIGHHPGRFPAAGHAGRRHRRHHLQLPAVHDPAAVRRAREDRPAAARGGRGPVRRPVAAARARSSGPSSAALLGVVVGVVMDYGAARRWASRASSRARSIGTCAHQRGVHPGHPAPRRCRASSRARC